MAPVIVRSKVAPVTSSLRSPFAYHLCLLPKSDRCRREASDLSFSAGATAIIPSQCQFFSLDQGVVLRLLLLILLETLRRCTVDFHAEKVITILGRGLCDGLCLGEHCGQC